ncbi:MAG TPA: pyruvate ferredoxin oxidoreductase [Dehalococcoidia bacterium]|nr:pyruvate ferredoxin oxidoreductase [Dehalococcoidia bacterium]
MTEVRVRKAELKALEGDRAVTEAMRQINPDVVAAYPVTPQTEIVMDFSQFVAEGLVDTEFIPVESEFAAMSSCIGASSAGARAMSATCGPGLELMWENLWVASGLRCPIVMAVVNRSHAAPLNILTDQTDMMGSRDTGWVQIYAENHQEVYDNFIQAVRIAEHPDILLPIMSGHAGFVLGHTLGRVEVLPDEVVRNFVGEYKPLYSLLDIDHPKTFGAYDHWDYFFEHRRQVFEAINNALRVIPEIGQEYGKISGRYYGLVEPYRLDDADVVIMIIGSGAGACREAVDEMREKGTKAGMLKVRCFRPFPAEEVVKALKDKKAVAVMDRCACFGAEGSPLFTETCAAFFNRDLRMKLINYFYGLGGRDTVPSEFCDILRELSQIAETGEIKPPFVRYLAVRE